MSYAGDVSPTDAYAALAADPDAVLVDVRTHAEWSYVGVPDLATLGKQVVTVEWQRYPSGAVNDRFIQEVRDAGVGADQPIYFLCRSGVRSKHAAAAATAAGMGPAYNISEGFEGPHDAQQHRAVSGWKVAGLPWKQS
ncbi:MAG TPA: rhodanese-like domain-containing protein [Dermatophilaceae bacterium]|jgi:rhodanese-related sulfurtransferase|nr:rhodanese-like domain-containing protein [Actinomycetales bacterium]HMT31833.1 rhodanese-like domain-containing protein [Dermatophilaceae bacterium]HMT89925.1 rhodanese-like domain-containing protein [Dermatophilaceae bacterium]